MTYPPLMTNALCCLSSSQLWRSTLSMASNSCCTSVACGLTSHGACYPTEAWKMANPQSWLWGVHCAVPHSSRTSSWNKQLPVINSKAVVGWTLASALLFKTSQDFVLKKAANSPVAWEFWEAVRKTSTSRGFVQAFNTPCLCLNIVKRRRDRSQEEPWMLNNATTPNFQSHSCWKVSTRSCHLSEDHETSNRE